MMKRRQLVSEQGFVMVPVIVLMVIAIAVALALLAIVDTQTGQSREQRSKDAAQTLAEGAISATANILADTASAAVWNVTSCDTVTGDLSTASTSPSTSFAAKLTAEVQARFGGSPEYSSSTSWRVHVCPVQSTDTRWSDTHLSRAAVAAATGAGPRVLWVRGKAIVRGDTASANARNSRVVASKVTQSTNPFAVPANYAVGTGAFSTYVGAALNTTTSSLLGGALTKPLIAQQDKKIGVRCGLLTTVSNLTTTCVTGALAGVGGTTNALGLGALGTALGTDRAQALSTWSMAPKDAIDAWLAEAQASGTYIASVPGVGNVRTLTAPAVGAGADCFSTTPTASQVIFIDQVGNGEQYCNLRADATAKILIIRRGGVRISAHFTGVVYALNQQECTNADGTCSAADRAGAAPREVVRIKGNTGRVTGSVWADGAGGSVGIYPELTLTGTGPNSSLLALGGTNGICSMPLVGPVLTTLGTTLSGLTGVVGSILPLVTGTEEEVRYPNGAAAPTGCDLLRNQLGGLTTSQLANVFGSGGTQTIVVSERRTRTCGALLPTGCALVPSLWGPWSAWSTRNTQAVTIPALLSTGTPSLTEQVAGILGQTLSGYQAIAYDATAVTNAAAQISQGAAPVIGTYRNVGPLT